MKIKVYTGFEWNLDEDETPNTFVNQLYDGEIVCDDKFIKIVNAETGEVLLEGNYGDFDTRED